MNKEDVGDPDLLYQAAIKGHAFVAGAGEGQPLVLPVVSQVQGHGEVLWEKCLRERPSLQNFSLKTLTSRSPHVVHLTTHIICGVCSKYEVLGLPPRD